MRVGIAIALGILLALFLKFRSTPAPTAPPSLAIASPRPQRAAVTAPNQDWVSIVEKKLKENRSRLADCVLKERSLSIAKMELSLLWDGAGTLQSLTLKPEPSSRVRECLWETMALWRIGVHSGLKPFSYTTELMFTGN